MWPQVRRQQRAHDAPPAVDDQRAVAGGDERHRTAGGKDRRAHIFWDWCRGDGESGERAPCLRQRGNGITRVAIGARDDAIGANLAVPRAYNPLAALSNDRLGRRSCEYPSTLAFCRFGETPREEERIQPAALLGEDTAMEGRRAGHGGDFVTIRESDRKTARRPAVRFLPGAGHELFVVRDLKVSTLDRIALDRVLCRQLVDYPARLAQQLEEALAAVGQTRQCAIDLAVRNRVSRVAA